MANEEPTTDCNFPELLARDLEVSGAVFASKSMTAGCPSSGLAASHDDDSHSIQGLDIPRRPTPYQPGATRPRPHSLAVTSNRTTSIEMFSHDESPFPGGFSDTDSESSVEIEQPAVRTREQSFTTAATSVSGRCSSIISHKPISPSSTTSQMDRARKGTWYDWLDADEDAASSSGTRESLDRPIAQSPLSALGFNTLNKRDSPALSSGTTLRPSTATTYHQIHPMTSERPHTSSGPARMERPRVVDIQPPLAVPKRKSSLKRTHQRASSTSAASSHPQKPMYNEAKNLEEDVRYFRGSLNSHPPMPLLATSYGRTIIDASKPSSLDSNGREQTRGISTNRSSRLSIAGGFMVDGRESEDGAYIEPPNHSRKPSLAMLGSWVSSNAEILAPRISNTGSAATGQGIPLPPEVVETLRISIACFPETILLSSSLSIETIRSYSKKLRHGALPAARMSEDNLSVFSFSSCSTKSPSRWGLPRLLQGRSSGQNSHYTTSLATTPEQAVTNSQTPVTPYWTPIKNIFPTGSDYLCDALYAHIVAYNYVNVLCPPLPMLPVRASVINGDENAQEIPKKAAIILGLQEAPGYSNARAPSPLRRIVSRRPGSPGSRRGSTVGESAALRDVQSGLGRCIAFLVATLKQRGEDTEVRDDASTLLQPEADMMDPLLIRALCEAVRCSEEAIC